MDNHTQYLPGISSHDPTTVSSLTPVPTVPTLLLLTSTSTGSKTKHFGEKECDVSVTKKLQPLARSCGLITTTTAKEISKPVREFLAMKQ